jgi:ankyrin repeat protein
MSLFSALPGDLKRSIALYLEQKDLAKLYEDFLFNEEDVYWKMKVFHKINPQRLYTLVENIWSSVKQIIEHDLLDAYIPTVSWSQDLIVSLYQHHRTKYTNLRDVNGESMIFYAFRNDYAIATFLEQNPNLNIQNNNGDTVLHVLVRIPNKHEHIDMLIKRKADVNILNKKGATPLYCSLLYKNNENNILTLLRGGANPNIGMCNGYPCLMEVARINNSKVILEEFLKYKADIHMLDKDGDTILTWACLEAKNSNNSDLIDILIKAGCNVNHRGLHSATPLIELIAKNNPVVLVKKLLDAGADVNIPDDRGCTPLMFAVKFSTISVVSLLLVQKNINIHAKDDEGLTAYDIAVKNYGPDEPVSVLLKGFMKKRKHDTQTSL